MKIASRATPEALAGHGLSTTVLKGCFSSFSCVPHQSRLYTENVFSISVKIQIHYQFATGFIKCLNNTQVQFLNSIHCSIMKKLHLGVHFLYSLKQTFQATLYKMCRSIGINLTSCGDLSLNERKCHIHTLQTFAKHCLIRCLVANFHFKKV